MRPLATTTVLLAVAAAIVPACAQELERMPPVTNEAAKKECGACHMAYQPQLLPADSWFANCDDVRSAGVAPLYAGEPGYRPEMDGDGDGIACEPYRGRR